MSTDSNDGSPSSFGSGSFSCSSSSSFGSGIFSFGSGSESDSYLNDLFAGDIPSFFSFGSGSGSESDSYLNDHGHQSLMNVDDNLFVCANLFGSEFSCDSLSDDRSTSGGKSVHFAGEIASSSGSGSGGDLSNSSGQEFATTDKNISSVKAGEIVHADANNASTFTSAASEAALGVGGDTLLDLPAATGVQKFNTDTRVDFLGKICKHLMTNHSSRHLPHHGKMKLIDFIGNGKGRSTYKQVIAEMCGAQEESLEVKRLTGMMKNYLKNIRRPSKPTQKGREIYNNFPIDVLSTT